MEVLEGVITQSLILGIMVLGIYISYRILDFPDLSVDGSFALGGAVIAISLKYGISPVVGSLFSLIAGMLAGLFTGILHVKLKVSNLLSGILVMLALYSINLRIMGRANIPLFNEKHLFKIDISPLIISISIILIMKILIDKFFQTGIGYTLKAVGDNPQMVKSLGIEIGKIKILGLMLSNGLVCFSGNIMAQYQGFSDVSMGIGSLILGIASIVIGKSLFERINFLKETSVIIIGTILYQIVILLAFNLGLKATDIKFITSFVIILFFTIDKFKSQITSRQVSL
ncbi:MAG: ABC transporter permease [Firmicutes bacterium]|nr:ABC transporter permease [Bacillota bacterium]